VDALSRDAIAAAFRTARKSDNYDAVLDAAERMGGAGPQAVASARARLLDPAPAVRAVACDVLTFAAEKFGIDEDAATELIAVAEAEHDSDVLWSIVRALGATTDGRAAPVLIHLAHHPDPDIRFQVAMALPLVAPTADLRPITATLIELSNDVDEEIRDWATFGLGAQLTVDGLDVRSALWARCFDPNPAVRAEGICGLARRRDPVAVPFVAQLLAAGDIDSAPVQAAAFLADPTLLYGLSMRDPDEPWVFEAQTACDPVLRAYTDEAAWSIFAYVSQAVTDRAVAIRCERLEPNIFLSVDEDQWAIVPLLRRANGDPARAAQFLLDDLADGLSR
jgi:HEAT repeat protein